MLNARTVTAKKKKTQKTKTLREQCQHRLFYRISIEIFGVWSVEWPLLDIC